MSQPFRRLNFKSPISNLKFLLWAILNRKLPFAFRSPPSFVRLLFSCQSSPIAARASALHAINGFPGLLTSIAFKTVQVLQKQPKLVGIERNTFQKSRDVYKLFPVLAEQRIESFEDETE